MEAVVNENVCTTDYTQTTSYSTSSLGKVISRVRPTMPKMQLC